MRYINPRFYLLTYFTFTQAVAFVIIV